MKKPIALLLSIISIFSLAACNGGGENSGNKIKIEVVNMDGGIGTDWLYNTEERFEAAVANTSYGSYVGADLKITSKQGLRNMTMNSEGFNVYFAERVDVPLFIKSGLFLNINDIVTEKDENGRSIEDVIYDTAKAGLKGLDGEYYALPHYEYYTGLSYDAETFDKTYAYFAAPECSADLKFNYPSPYGNADFISNVASKKSCGPDGVYDTEDDGLPTSLQELLILCHYLKANNVAPITLSGMWTNMSNYLMSGLWTSLAGYEQMQTVYSFNGTIEAIKLDENGDYMFTNENLFTGIDYIKKPQTEIIDITLENGYRVHDMVEKYYAVAFLEAIMKEGFMDEASLSSSVSHTGAQSNFIFGSSSTGQLDRGMLIEASYWWNESKLAYNFEDYYDHTNKTSKDIRWMSLPTSLNTTTTVGAGEKISLLDSGQGVCFVNSNIAGNTDLIAAIKDFLQYVYSDAELRAFTVETGCGRPMKYTLQSSDISAMPEFYQDVWDYRQEGKIVYFSADNKVFRNYGTNFTVSLECAVFSPMYNNASYKDFYAPLDKGASTAELIKATSISKAVWTTYTTD